MKKFHITLIIIGALFVTLMYQPNRMAVAQLLQNTALYLRVMGVGTSSSPLAVMNLDCDSGDQYYSCTTYTTAAALAKGTIRVNINGTARYMRFYEGAQ